MLLYGLKAYLLNESHVASLDFVVNRFSMKLFNINIEIVQACQGIFGFALYLVYSCPSSEVRLLRDGFMNTFMAADKYNIQLLIKRQTVDRNVLK